VEPSPVNLGHWLLAFVLTLALELPLVVGLGRPLEARLVRRIATALLANAVTHPAVWFVFPRLPWPWPAVLAAAEAWAWLAEAAIYRALLREAGWRASLLLSLAANALSFGVGLLLSAAGVIG